MSHPNDPASLTKRLSVCRNPIFSRLAMIIAGLGVIVGVMIAFTIAITVDPVYLGLGLGTITGASFPIASIGAFEMGLRISNDT